MKWIVAAAVGIGLLVLAAYSPAWAQDRASWFKSLKQPGTGISCCDVSDCKQTRAEWRGEGWRAALPDGTMVSVPDAKIVKNKPSIDGEAYLCSGPASGAVYCFIPPNMGF